MATQTDVELIDYHDRSVKVNEHELEANRGIVEDTVRQFCSFLNAKGQFGNHKVDFTTQGSAYEDLKTKKADEFDTIITILERRAGHSTFLLHSGNDNHAVSQDLQNMKKSMPAALNCLHPIVLDDEAKKTKGYENMQGKWETRKHKDKSHACLSAEGALAEMQRLLGEFVSSKPAVKGVKKFQTPVRGDPAMKLTVHKHDGSEIRIDFVPGVREKGATSHGDTYYVPKLKHALRAFKNDYRLKLLWLQSFHQKEKYIVLRKRTPNQRRNLRILKSIFKKDVDTFFWKTIFMWEDVGEFPENPTEFMKKMISIFAGGLRAELVHRTKTEVCTDGICQRATTRPGDRLLVTGFRNCENVLTREENATVQKLRDKFEKLADQLNSGDNSGLLAEMRKAQ